MFLYFKYFDLCFFFLIEISGEINYFFIKYWFNNIIVKFDKKCFFFYYNFRQLFKYNDDFLIQLSLMFSISKLRSKIYVLKTKNFKELVFYKSCFISEYVLLY